jgi:hypothetical protein
MLNVSLVPILGDTGYMDSGVQFGRRWNEPHFTATKRGSATGHCPSEHPGRSP